MTREQTQWEYRVVGDDGRDAVGLIVAALWNWLVHPLTG